MKKLFSNACLLCLLLVVQHVSGQTTKISISEIILNLNGVTLKGNGVSVSLVEGKTSEKLTIFKNDTLMVMAAYRLHSQNKKTDEVKDASFGLDIFYTCKYFNTSKEDKVERLYFLNEKFQFIEKEIINISESKNANTIVKIGYKGTVIQ